MAVRPIQMAVATLIDRQWATPEEIKAWDTEAKEVATDAGEFAAASPEPDPADVGLYVYSDPQTWQPDEAMHPRARD